MVETITRKARHILVLDADVVPALTVCRSLARRNYLVDVASAGTAPIASYSRGVANCFCYPDPLLCQEDFLGWLEGQLLTRHYDLIIPVTERTLVPLSDHRDRFPGAPFAMAEEDGLSRVLDKRETFKLAETLGVPVPQSHYLADSGELERLVPGLSFPVVVKPSRSVSSGDLGYVRHNVSYANNETELRRQCAERLRHSPVILQEYFDGVGAGIELIAREGEILYPFQHIRLHEVPLTGGGSSFRVSAAIEPCLLEAAGKLISALRWTGVAMVEFKWNPGSGSFRLMEINGRLWGSLPLAVAAGADFPAMLAELAFTGQLGEYPAYRRGVYCRNLTSDLMWHEMLLRNRGNTGHRPAIPGPRAPDLARIPPARVVLRDLARLFSPRHYFDTQSLADPLPGLVEIRRLLAAYAARLGGLVSTQYLVWRQRLLWHNGTVAERLRGARTVLFICYGNINRSALAEVVLKSMLAGSCSKRILSAGFHAEEYRPADQRMRRIASDRGYDLSGSKSSRITEALIAGSDIIFVMEKQHRDRLLAQYPLAADKTFLLGPGCQEGGRGAAEIPDPYNQSEALYIACFTRIHQAVARLNESLRTPHAG